jgi:hypothetical protein
MVIRIISEHLDPLIERHCQDSARPFHVLNGTGIKIRKFSRTHGQVFAFMGNNRFKFEHVKHNFLSI